MFFIQFITIAFLILTPYALLAQTAVNIADETPISEEEDEDDFLNDLVFGETEEVDCSSILEYTKKYLNLSQKNHTLLAMSASRIEREAFIPSKTIEERDQLKQDVSDTVALVKENELALSNKSIAILEVLPSCLEIQE